MFFKNRFSVKACNNNFAEEHLLVGLEEDVLGLVGVVEDVGLGDVGRQRDSGHVVDATRCVVHVLVRVGVVLHLDVALHVPPVPCRTRTCQPHGVVMQ